MAAVARGDGFDCNFDGRQEVLLQSTQGNVYINRRVHPIPATIIEANTEAHEAIAADNKASGLASSPWNYYKLVNVQYKPIDKPNPGQDYAGVDAATYYQANIVVETDYNLQLFSGTFQPTNNPDGSAIDTLKGCRPSTSSPISTPPATLPRTSTTTATVSIWEAAWDATVTPRPSEAETSASSSRP